MTEATEVFVRLRGEISGTPVCRLITNAIIYFNSSVLSQLLTSFEYQNDDKRI